MPSGTLLWKPHRSSEDSANVLSDEEAQAAVEAIESKVKSDASTETGAVYYDRTDAAVKMKRNDGDVRLASLPPLSRSGNWMHIADRNEFAAVLIDGRPACSTLHL